MFLCICNCCSNVECNSNEEGRNGRNVWNMCYSSNLEIIRDYIQCSVQHGTHKQRESA